MTLHNGLTQAEREELFARASRIPDDAHREELGQNFANEFTLHPAVVAEQVVLVRTSADRVLNAITPDAERRYAAIMALKNGNVQQAIPLFADAGAIKELLVIGEEYRKTQPLVALSAFEFAQDSEGALHILKQALNDGDDALVMEALRVAQNAKASTKLNVD